jgi:hypothetical protein
MHEHLVQILAEAPDPVLQKARDAEERLLFWKERTKAVLSPHVDGRPRSFTERLRLLFAMPILLMENLRLWQFAPRGEERRMLARNLRAVWLAVNRFGAAFQRLDILDSYRCIPDS